MKEKEYKECAYCAKLVELTAGRKAAIQRYMKLGLSGRVFCDEQCNTQYHNALSRERKAENNAV
jgi:hypothetical protein